MIQADKETDARYKFLRDRHGETNPQANGYRLSSFFEREQRVLLSALNRNLGPFLDIACGSGLMLSPLLKEGRDVYGLDFNNDACHAAHQNGLKIIRGDAFNLPLPDRSIGQIVNCQFLNQQPAEETRKFIEESARVLKSGGQLIILWRHARSLVHRSAHAVFTFMDKFTGQPPFPQYEHSFDEIKRFAKGAGLQVEQEAVTLPFLKPDYIQSDSFVAHLIGASQYIVLKKP
jgi:SAM-dependent methyltransferase